MSSPGATGTGAPSSDPEIATKPSPTDSPSGGLDPDTKQKLEEMFSEYAEKDLHEAVGGLAQIGFDFVGKKRYEEAVRLKKEEEFNKKAYSLTSDQKKKLGRTGLICLSVFDVAMSPKTLAVVIFALVAKSVLDECKSREYPEEKKIRKPRSDAGKKRGPKTPLKKVKKKGKKKK